jgi:DNA (cytosine-5)-methyltransferase 1
MENRHALVQSFLTQYNKASVGSNVGKPLPTVMGQIKNGLVQAFLNKHYTGVVGSKLQSPLGTVTAVDHHSLTSAFLTKFRGTCRHGQDARDPMPTLTGGGLHIAEVRAFLIKYFGTAIGQSLRVPAGTLTAKHRLGLVEVQGADYQIADIGLRMLEPRELLKAQFGKYADDYILLGSKTRQVAAIGNSVCPEEAEALVKANVVIQKMKEKV